MLITSPKSHKAGCQNVSEYLSPAKNTCCSEVEKFWAENEEAKSIELYLRLNSTECILSWGKVTSSRFARFVQINPFWPAGKSLNLLFTQKISKYKRELLQGTVTINVTKGQNNGDAWVKPEISGHCLLVDMVLHQHQWTWCYTSTSGLGVTPAPVDMVLHQHQWTWCYTSTSAPETVNSGGR